MDAQDRSCTQVNRTDSSDLSGTHLDRHCYHRHSASTSSYHTDPNPATTLQGHRRRFSIHSSMAVSSTTSVASSSSSSSSTSSYSFSCPAQSHGQSTCCRHHTQASTHRARRQSAVVSITGSSPSFFRRIFKAFVGSGIGVHPLDRSASDQSEYTEDPHESDTHRERSVPCGECEYYCGESTMSTSCNRTMDPTAPGQQSNSEFRCRNATSTKQAGRGLLSVRSGRASSIGGDSNEYIKGTCGKQRRSSVTSSIAGVSIHDDLIADWKSSSDKTRALNNNQQYRQHFTGQGVISTSSNNSDQNDAIKRRLSFFKSVVAETSSTSRRGSAFSTKSQETAVNLTGINFGDELQNVEYDRDDNAMDLDDDDEEDDELEHYDENGDDSRCRHHYTTQNAMVTDDLELDLQPHRHAIRLSRKCLRRPSFLSDKNSLVLKNKASGGCGISPPLQLERTERPSPIHLPEILHLIFQFAVDMTPQEDYSQREIHSCMLVCKQWYLVAQKTLWRDIRFKNPTKLELFIDLLKRTETVECLGIENRNQQPGEKSIVSLQRQGQGQKRCTNIATRDQSDMPVEHSIMSPLAMQRRIQERAATVKKIVLHKLKLIEDDDIMPLTSWFHNLQTVEFYICEKLTDKIVTAVAKSCPQLQQLLMPGCAKVTDSGITQIALNCPRMKHLDLRACSSVSDESLILVAKHCPELWHLNVGRVSSASKVTGRSIVEIAKNTNLNTLGLAGCAMTDDAVIEIARHSRSGLHRISLNSCTALTSASVWALMQLCPNLAVLEIKQCLLVADMATLYRFSTRRVLVELCPELQRRLLAYKVELAAMNTSMQSNNIATTQAAGSSGGNAMDTATTS